MNNKKATVGCCVRFKPENINHYSLDGVEPGALGIVSGFDAGDVVVSFSRPDGSICEGFYAFSKDVEVIDA